MSTEIRDLRPADNEDVLSTNVVITFLVVGSEEEPIVAADIDVVVGGAPMIMAGISVNQAQSGLNPRPDVNGVEVTLVTPSLREKTRHSLEVFAAGELVSDTTFVVPVVRGPYIASISPAPGANNQALSPVVVIDIAPADIDSEVKAAVVETNGTGTLVGSQLTVEGITFHRGHEKRRIDIDGAPVFIVSIQGPKIVTVSSGATPGVGLAVTLYAAAGLDIGISDGVRPMLSGVPRPGTGWTAELLTPAQADWLKVRLTRTGAAFANGKVVDLSLRVSDDRGRQSILGSFFYVGDQLAPRVHNVSPAPWSAGVPTSTNPIFDITDAAGVDSFNVEVSGVEAIIGNAPQIGAFFTSTVTPITGGFRVELKKTGGWSGTPVIMVSATDENGNIMPPTTWLMSYAPLTSKNDQAGLPPGELVRTLALNLSTSPFMQPLALRHTGFAADGFWYTDGEIDSSRVASWSLEAVTVDRPDGDPTFPALSCITVSKDGWVIYGDGGVKEWMRCRATLSGAWSMARGEAETTDAACAENMPVFAMACGQDILIVDFVNDNAKLINKQGLQVSSTTIAQRRQNAAATPDPAYALADDVGDYEAVGVWSNGRSWMVSAGRGADIELAWAVDFQDADVFAQAKDVPLRTDRRTAIIGGGSTGWKRMQATGLPGTGLYAAHDEGFVLIDWARTLGALAGVQWQQGQVGAQSVDVMPGLALLTSAEGAELMDITGATPELLQSFDATAMGIPTDLKAGVMDRGLEADTGWLYFLDDTAAYRYRHQRPTAIAGGRLTTVHTFGSGVAQDISCASSTPAYGAAWVGMATVIAEELVESPD